MQNINKGKNSYILTSPVSKIKFEKQEALWENLTFSNSCEKT